MDELFEGNPLSSIIQDINSIKKNILTKDEFGRSMKRLKFELLLGALLIFIGFAVSSYLLIIWSLQ